MLVELVGYIAGCCTTIAFLPQVIKVYRTKSAGDISWYMMMLFNVGLLLWMIYGMYTHSYPIIIANVVSFVLAAAILFMKYYYEKK